nr:immunoglobulin light chain junction region [Macaca mulatta]
CQVYDSSANLLF